MTQDYYSILGVTTKAGQAEIRAAYRALMRIYHPDADPSVEAAERSREINVAYAVLSNAQKRASYDEGISARRAVHFEPDPREGKGRRRRSLLGPVAATGFAVIAAGMIAFAVFPPVQSPFSKGTYGKVEPVAEPASANLAQKSELGCDGQAVTALIKQEIFSRAAGRRPEAALDLRQVEKFAAARLRLQNSDGKGCKAGLTIDIPANVAVDGGRTNLNAEIAFKLSQAAGGLQLASLSGADHVIASLTTLGPPPNEGDVESFRVAEAPVADNRDRLIAPATSLKPRVVRSPAAEGEVVSKRTSQCDALASRAERIVCESGNLKSLDRQLTNFYRQSWDGADERKRSALLGSRLRFDERRDACTTSNCMTTTYVDRLREISDIMAGKPSP